MKRCTRHIENLIERGKLGAKNGLHRTHTLIAEYPYCLRLEIQSQQKARPTGAPPTGKPGHYVSIPHFVEQ